MMIRKFSCVSCKLEKHYLHIDCKARYIDWKPSEYYMVAQKHQRHFGVSFNEKGQLNDPLP